MRRIGFFGGAFSPVHAVHVNLIQHTLATGIAAEVVVVPSADSYPKAGLLRGRDRLLLLQLALKDVPACVISAVDLNCMRFPDPLETAAEISAQFLRAPTDELVWIMGGDRLARVAANGRLRHYAERYRLVVFERGPYDRTKLLTMPEVVAWSHQLEFHAFPEERSSAAVRSEEVFSAFAALIGFRWNYVELTGLPRSGGQS